MKFGQLIEFNVRKIFIQKLYWKWSMETSSRSLFFKKKNYKVKENGQNVSLSRLSLRHT